jgi:DNA-directed RNA polymerase subunit RPC12/RpoP
MSIHYRAMEHLEKAKQLIEQGDADALRYAALDLRYAIEHLFYRLIPQYKTELPDDVLEGKTWQPGQIIDMIADIDPGVTKDRTLSIGYESAPGVPASEMHVMGTQSGISKELVRKAYHALGFYLHARLDGEPHDLAKLRKKLNKLLPDLEKFEGDRVIMSGFTAQVTFKCGECQRPIVKRVETLEETPYVKCPNKTCGALYKVTPHGDLYEHRMLEQNVVCKGCGADNWVGSHALERAAEQNGSMQCRQCGMGYQVRRFIHVDPLESSSGTSRDEGGNS